MTVAIDVKPQVTTKKTANGFYYAVDSGETDLNRVVSSDELNELGIVDIAVSGFNNYLPFHSQKQLDAFIKDKKSKYMPQALKTTDNESLVDNKPSEPAQPAHIKSANPSKVSEDEKIQDITIVEGEVSLVLKNGEMVSLAHPVYRVYPDKKGELLDINVVESYIAKQWVDEIRSSLFNMRPEGEVVADSALVKTPKKGIANASSSFSSASFITIVGGLVAILVLLLVTSVILDKKGASNNQLASNGGVSVEALQEAGIATPPLLNTGSSNSGAPRMLTPQEATAENLAKVQAQQTEAMLEKMGVDLSATEQDLGCFVGES